MGLKSSPSHKLATSFYFAGPRLNCWSSIGSLQCTILRPLISNLRISCSFLPSSDREEGWVWRARRKGLPPFSAAPPPLYHPLLAQTAVPVLQVVQLLVSRKSGYLILWRHLVVLCCSTQCRQLDKLEKNLFLREKNSWGREMGREENKTRWKLKEGAIIAFGELELRVCIRLDLGPDSTAYELCDLGLVLSLL